jgi:hypothetical protein
MTALWGEIIVLGIIVGYFAIAVWYLSQPMEDDEQQQH